MAEGLGTILLHADDELGARHAEVAPSISVSTTFRQPQGVDLIGEYDPAHPKFHVYSRESQEVNSRVERVLGELHGLGKHALTFSSGLSAVFAALVHCAPRRIAVSGGYFGSHGTIAVYGQAAQRPIPLIALDDVYAAGDLCWLETPVNPDGTARGIRHYAERIHAVGGRLCVDATFAPPPLANPFDFGADIVMHSGDPAATKYFGGHSDLLGGVLVVKSQEEWHKLWDIRVHPGNNLGSLEAWLLLRSLRTLHVRVPRQSATATALAQWLHRVSQIPAGETWDGVPGARVHGVTHASLQHEPWVKEQLSGGYPATFSILLESKEYAAELPYLLKHFAAATSLGGVESLIEQRCNADGVSDPRLLRISVGLEELEDLKADLRQGLNRLGRKGHMSSLPIAITNTEVPRALSQIKIRATENHLDKEYTQQPPRLLRTAWLVSQAEHESFDVRFRPISCGQPCYTTVSRPCSMRLCVRDSLADFVLARASTGPLCQCYC
ncbi:PLP-dependent transferase [Auricularia subglabra TFB-10046 SS5]|nr:PLP-dependent transferase [Auricularia subglabra TFB-10046 SS5]